MDPANTMSEKSRRKGVVRKPYLVPAARSAVYQGPKAGGRIDLFSLFYKGQVPERGTLALATFTFGMATGVLWELVTWTTGLTSSASGSPLARTMP